MKEPGAAQRDTEDSRDAVVLFDGEIDAGDSSGSMCNGAASAVIEAAWRRSGAAGVAAIDGVFAVALRAAGQLFAYRDPSGLRALFFRPATEGGWQVASSLGTIAGCAAIERRSLHEYLRLLDIAAPHTLLQGVRSLQPGCMVGLASSEPVPIELPRPPSCNAPSAIFDHAVQEVDDRLQASIANHLRGASRPAALLSAGVDSALVCAVTSRQAPHTVALTVGFDGDEYDEAPVAARIAAHLGLRHEVLRFSREDYLRGFDRLACSMDQPMADPATMATLLAFEYCRKKFDVVLDGSGADEAVGAMPPRHVRLAVGVGGLMPSALRRWLVRIMSHVPGLAGYTSILDFEHPAEPLMRWQGFTRAEIEELCGEPVSLEQTTFYRTFARFARHAHYERYSALLDAMPCDRLTQAMRLTGACVRFPYCARGVDHFLRQLPTDWRWLPGQPKRILRELLARYVPRAIWDGPKRGFTFPLHDFLAGDGWALVHRHLLDGCWLDRGLLRPEVVRRYAQQYIGGENGLLFRVWALVVLGAWLDSHSELL